MRRVVCIFLLFAAVFTARAQDYPPEWVGYTFGEYLYDIQSDHNVRNLSETEFKNRLLDVARTNLAKQVQVRVQDAAELDKIAVDGRTSTLYRSSIHFSTDVDLKLVETRTLYNPNDKKGFAIAYIDKAAARRYYINELSILYNTICNTVSVAEEFVSDGFKPKARTALGDAAKLLPQSEESLFWLNIFGGINSEIVGWQHKFNSIEQKINRMQSELQHGTVICLTCCADLFGKPYLTLQNELKGLLSADGCSFTDEPEDADWVIAVECSTREYDSRSFGGVNSYFSYVDAQITIDKTATGQRICEDEIEIKGGHTLNYREAARAAYKDAKQQIGKTITKILNQ